MKINCGPTAAERRLKRRSAKQEWHDFFVLWPRRVGKGDCRWLEVIQRRGYYHYYWGYEYRAKGKK